MSRRKVTKSKDSVYEEWKEKQEKGMKKEKGTKKNVMKEPLRVEEEGD